MKFVVDSNFLRDKKLRQYLSKGKSHYAVLTDYAAMEAYKGDTLASIFKSMRILAEFPKQVIVLKGTTTIGKLSGRSSGLTRRMVWTELTQGFPEFCEQLKLAQAGDRRLERQLLDYGAAATEHLDEILANAAGLQVAMINVSKEFSAAELRALRTGGKYTPTIAKKTMELVDDLTVRAMKAHPHGVKRGQYKETPNTFLYRNSLAHVVYMIQWMRKGSQINTRPEKIRNDLVDINFATYATYFDGILTNDKKLNELHDETRYLLSLIIRDVANRTGR